MIPRIKLDISWRDLFAGFGYCLAPGNLSKCYSNVERLWATKDAAITHLSVRSGFDLLLRALDFAPGSEIIISAVTIPHMVDIIQEHQLTAVPVDLDTKGMSINSSELESLITPRTKAVLVAHLFGGRLDLNGVAEVTKRHGLFLIEDCAQAYNGDDFRGDERAAVSMFSFGTIKTATALGGALFTVRDKELLASLRAHRKTLPVYENSYFARKIMRTGFIMLLGNRLIYPLFVRLFSLLHRDYDDFINQSVRGFSGSNFFDRIRCQPPPAMVALLRRRLRKIKNNHCQRRAALGNMVARGLPAEMSLLGREGFNHTHWLAPCVSPAPDELVARLRHNGFDATRGCSSLVSVPAPVNFPQPSKASNALKNIVYLPVYPPAGTKAVYRMLKVIKCFAATLDKPDKVGVNDSNHDFLWRIS